MKTENKTNEVDNSQAIVAFNAALTHEKADTVILCDCSGSMSQPSGSGKSRFAVMQECLLRVVSSMTGEAAVILFGARTKKLASWEAFDADRWHVGATTNLAAALHNAARMNPSHIVVITDGQPNVAHTAIAQARTMLCRIDVYYCGNGEVETVNFCRELVQFGGEAVIDPQPQHATKRPPFSAIASPENAGDSGRRAS
jgi:hypothetical protein